jgi:hypothetical protein
MFEKRWTEFEFFLLMATHDRHVMTSYVASPHLLIILTKLFLSLPLDCQEKKCVVVQDKGTELVSEVGHF